jgi:hypothetical protein
LGLAGKGYAGKVYFQKFSVTFSIGWGMKDGVNIVKNIFGAKGLGLIAFTIENKF